MRRVLLSSFAAVTVALFAAPSAQAQSLFTAILTGAAERPNPVVTPASGQATVQLFSGGPTGAFIRISNFSASGFPVPITLAHIHGNANASANGPVFYDFGGNSAIIGQTSFGPLTFDVNLPASLTAGGNTFTQAQQINVLQSGLMYFNLHTSANPGGEIRGQIVATTAPEPGSIALMLTGLTSVGVLIRRRRS
jgi:hypothetical protein